MKGQYTDSEFTQMLKKAGAMRSDMDYTSKTAWIQFGKYTINYYLQESDGSWTNYDCKTI